MPVNSNQVQALYAIPFIARINRELTHLDTWWTAVSLVGKVNHQDVGGHFLQTLSEAQEQFQALRQDFVHQLAQITHQNIDTTLSLRAQALVDLLFRNLFERTADVAFLAQDPTIADLCHVQLSDYHPYLQTYCGLYSVYQNVAIFNDTLTLMARARNLTEQRIDKSKLMEALAQSGYCEWHAPSMSNLNTASIYYAHAIEKNGKKEGVLLLEFNLQEELHEIEMFLTKENPDYLLALSGENSTVWNKHNLNTHQTLEINKNSAALSKSFSSFQGYAGLPWQATVSLPITSAISDKNDDNGIRLNSTLFPSGLYHIQKLSDFSLLLVILNGKIISLQRHAQAFLPILEDFQRIGKSINACLSGTIKRIYMLNYDRIQTEMRFSSQLAAEFFSRSFYERANDCRWWSLNPDLMLHISQNQHQKLSTVLTDIHTLYTVYQSLIIYNPAGEIMATSALNTTNQTTTNKLDFSVMTCLEPLTYHAVAHADVNNQDTFSFYTAIHINNEMNAILSITFDAKTQLTMMLTDVLPTQNHECTHQNWAAFATQVGVIAQTEHTPNSIKEQTWLQLEYPQNLAIGETKLIEKHINGQRYCIAMTRSAPYREFLLQTGFDHIVFAIVGQVI